MINQTSMTNTKSGGTETESHKENWGNQATDKKNMKKGPSPCAVKIIQESQKEKGKLEKIMKFVQEFSQPTKPKSRSPCKPQQNPKLTNCINTL